MKSTYNIVKYLEIPMLTKKGLKILKENLAHALAFFLLFTLLYVFYIALSFRYSSYTELSYKELLDRTFLFSAVFSAILSIFFIFLSRDKFKNSSYMNYFYNTNVKANHLILSGYLLLFLFHLIVIIGVLLPTIMVNIVIFETSESLVKLIILMILSSSLIFFCMLFLWMVSFIFASKLKKEEIVHYCLFIFFIGTVVFGAYAGYKFLFLHPMSIHLFYSIISFILFFSVLLILFHKISGPYLFLHFSDRWKMKRTSLFYIEAFKGKKRFFHLLKLELLNVIRNHTLKEQIFLFLALIALTYFFYQMTTVEEFGFYFSFIMNYGLVEIMIILPILMGSFYKEHLIAFYHLHTDGYIYISAYTLLYFTINTLFVLLFMIIPVFMIDQPIEITVHLLPKILFVTTFSMLVGFLIPVNSFNKIFLLISTVIIIGILEFVLLSMITDVTAQNTFYICSAVLFLTIIYTFYVRRPVFN